MASPTVTSMSLGPSATSIVPCEGIPNLDYSGLNGSVCAVSIPPAQVNVTSCCNGAVRVVNNCTQYCETNNAVNFGDCVNDLHDGFHLDTTCQVVNGTMTGGNMTTNTTIPDTGAAAGLNPIYGTSAIGVVASLALILLVL